MGARPDEDGLYPDDLDEQATSMDLASTLPAPPAAALAVAAPVAGRRLPPPPPFDWASIPYECVRARLLRRRAAVRLLRRRVLTRRRHRKTSAQELADVWRQARAKLR